MKMRKTVAAAFVSCCFMTQAACSLLQNPEVIVRKEGKAYELIIRPAGNSEISNSVNAYPTFNSKRY